MLQIIRILAMYIILLQKRGNKIKVFPNITAQNDIFYL